MAKSFGVGQVVYHDKLGECVIKEVQNFSAWAEIEGIDKQIEYTDTAAKLVLVYDGGEAAVSPDQVWTPEEWKAFWGEDRTKIFGSGR